LGVRLVNLDEGGSVVSITQVKDVPDSPDSSDNPDSSVAPAAE